MDQKTIGGLRFNDHNMEVQRQRFLYINWTCEWNMGFRTDFEKKVCFFIFET